MPAWLVLSMFLTVGWIPDGGVQMYDPNRVTLVSGMFYQRFEAEATIAKVVRFGGSVEIRDWPLPTTARAGFSFWPEALDSIVFAEVILGPLSAGWEHECVHPVVPYLGEGLPVGALWDRWEDRVYLRIGGKF